LSQQIFSVEQAVAINQSILIFEFFLVEAHTPD
jgi:hypothetical protein